MGPSIKAWCAAHHKAIAALLVSLSLLGLAGWWWLVRPQEPSHLRASRLPRGPYQKVIREIVDVVASEAEALGFTLELEEIDSEGSSETVGQLLSGRVDIGLIQANTPLPSSTRIRAIASIYPEVYCWFSRTGQNDLYTEAQAANRRDTPLRIGSLGEGSQTYVDLRTIMKHYGFDDEKIQLLRVSYPEGAAQLKSGKIDVAFYVTGLMSEDVRKLHDSREIKQLGFAMREGFLQSLRELQPYDIQPGAFGAGKPESRISTVCTDALLVTRSDVPATTIYDLTKALFVCQSRLHDRVSYLRINRISKDSDFPVHAGALNFYDGFPPGWLQRNEWIIALLLSLSALVIAVTALYNDIFNLRKRRAETAASE